MNNNNAQQNNKYNQQMSSTWRSSRVTSSSIATIESMLHGCSAIACKYAAVNNINKSNKMPHTTAVGLNQLVKIPVRI